MWAFRSEENFDYKLLKITKKIFDVKMKEIMLLNT